MTNVTVVVQDVCAATAMHLDPRNVKARLLRGKCCEGRQDLLSARLAYKQAQLFENIDAGTKHAANKVISCHSAACKPTCCSPINNVVQSLQS